MRRRDDLMGPTLRSVLATLCLIVSPLASAVSVDDWLTETHDGALHAVRAGGVFDWRMARSLRPAG